MGWYSNASAEIRYDFQISKIGTGSQPSRLPGAVHIGVRGAQGRDVAYWHLTTIPSVFVFGRYWSNSGHRAALTLDGSVANDPKRTSG